MKKILCFFIFLANFMLAIAHFATMLGGDSSFAPGRSVIHLTIFLILLILNMVFLIYYLRFLDDKLKGKNKFNRMIYIGFISVIVLFIFLFYEIFCGAKINSFTIIIMDVTGVYILAVSLFLGCLLDSKSSTS